ncbi:MAG: TolC family protein [Opitutaceae bacterium]|nr:TolC family protein [Opitutaceae bacterium]
MRRPFSILLLSVLVAAQAAEPIALTLEQALASAEGVNSNVLLSREAAAQALEQANLQRAGVLPNVNLTANQRRTRNLNILSTTGALSETRPSSRFDARLGATYQLLNPQVLSAGQAARTGAEAARLDVRATIQAAQASVAQAYFAHLRNLRRLDVLDANITRAKSLHDLARNQLAAGIATQIDVTRAEAQVAQAEQARLQQVTSVVQSELVFKRLLNLDPAAPLTLADFPLKRVDAGILSLPESRTSFEQRADWLRGQKALEQSKLDVRTAKFERLPTLALAGDYGRAAANFDDNGKRKVWTFGATVSMPIFDGLRAGADHRAALSRQKVQQARLNSLELQISSELRLARQDASSRYAQIEVAEKNSRLAEEQLRLARARYNEGVADNREVIEAQAQLAFAADNLVDAVYQYNLSRVELARAKGDVRTVLAEKAP